MVSALAVAQANNKQPNVKQDMAVKRRIAFQ
jgi:hypothetical protein